jgi:hypothetical protein
MYLPSEKPITLLAYCGAVLFLALNILTSYYTSDAPYYSLLYVFITLPLIWTGLRAMNKMGKPFKNPYSTGPWSNNAQNPLMSYPKKKRW